MRRPSLLLTFGLLSVIPMLLLGLVLGIVIRQEMEDQAVGGARKTATFVANFAIPAYLPAESVEQGLTPRDRATLGAVVQAGGIVGAGAEGLEIRDRTGRIVFSDQPGATGRLVPIGIDFADVLAGRTTSRVITTRGTKALAIAVPLRYPGRFRASGTVTLYLPHALVSQHVADHTHTIYVILAGGLALLYLLLFPVVLRASHALRRHAAEHEHLAHHDALTGLPNRTMFADRVEQALAEEGATLAVMVVDVDRFKDINDRLGHLNGDLVLKMVADRLAGSVRSTTDLVARLGGDEFGVLLPHSSREAAERVVCRITEALRAPIEAEGAVVHARASVGIAVAPEHGAELDVVLRAADLAMYAAKQRSSGFDFAREPHAAAAA